MLRNGSCPAQRSDCPPSSNTRVFTVYVLPEHNRPAGAQQKVRLSTRRLPLVPEGRAERVSLSPAYRGPPTSGGLLVRVALQLVEFNAVQLLEALLAELAGEVVVRL